MFFWTVISSLMFCLVAFRRQTSGQVVSGGQFEETCDMQERTNQFQSGTPCLKYSAFTWQSLSINKTCTKTYDFILVQNSYMKQIGNDAFNGLEDCGLEKFVFRNNSGRNGDLKFNVDFSNTSITRFHIFNNHHMTLNRTTFNKNAINITLKHNIITDLPKDLFYDLTSLKELRITHNGLTSLPKRLFRDLTSLETLWITDNNLTSLPEAIFRKLKSLKILKINQNHLKCLPEGIFRNLTSLEDLNMRDNDFTALPESLFADLTALNILLLSKNHLRSLSASAVKLRRTGTNLTRPSIVAKGNNFTHLPLCFSQLGTFHYDDNPEINLTGPPLILINSFIPENPCASDSTAAEESTSSTGQPITLNNINADTSTNNSTLTTVQTPEKKFDWLYFIFTVIFILGLPILGVAVWFIRKDIMADREIEHELEAERNDARERHYKLIRARNARNGEPEMQERDPKMAQETVKTKKFKTTSGEATVTIDERKKTVIFKKSKTTEKRKFDEPQSIVAVSKSLASKRSGFSKSPSGKSGKPSMLSGASKNLKQSQTTTVSKSRTTLGSEMKTAKSASGKSVKQSKFPAALNRNGRDNRNVAQTSTGITSDVLKKPEVKK